MNTPASKTSPDDAVLSKLHAPGQRHRRLGRAEVSMEHKPWTPAEETVVRKFYADAPTMVIAAALARSMSSIYQFARRLGLQKSEAYLSGVDSGHLDGVRGGAGRFIKGQQPWNKGQSFEAGGRSVQTRFKSGRRPHTWLHVGSYRIIKNGTLQRKISDAPGSKSKRWRGVHELVWIEHNGPVPAGHIVVFRPGMRTTDADLITIDRVECITRAENMLRNTLQRYPREIVRAIQMRGTLNRRIRNVQDHQ